MDKNHSYQLTALVSSTASTCGSPDLAIDSISLPLQTTPLPPHQKNLQAFDEHLHRSLVQERGKYHVGSMLVETLRREMT